MITTMPSYKERRQALRISLSNKDDSSITISPRFPTIGRVFARFLVLVIGICCREQIFRTCSAFTTTTTQQLVLPVASASRRLKVAPSCHGLFYQRGGGGETTHERQQHNYWKRCYSHSFARSASRNDGELECANTNTTVNNDNGDNSNSINVPEKNKNIDISTNSLLSAAAELSSLSRGFISLFSSEVDTDALRREFDRIDTSRNSHSTLAK